MLRRSLTQMLRDREREIIELALTAANGSMTQAARALQTDRPNLIRRTRRLGIARQEQPVSTE